MSSARLPGKMKDIPDDRLGADFISKRIDCYSSVARASILLAIYLGFDHAYLVGFDYTHIPNRGHHWYEKGRGVTYEQKDYQNEFFDIAKEFIDITTITLNGLGHNLDSISYKNHTGLDPVYRENTDLVDDQYLKVLSTWPGNSIY
jgi:hypothetical protein